MSEYNYKTFPLDADQPDFEKFPNVARVGTPAPEGTLIDAKTNGVVELGELYRKGVSVIEFGSFT
jgi:hypothetical protein